MQPNYFTCTLGQALQWKAENKQEPKFTGVVDLVDRRAAEAPNEPAAGFAGLNSKNSESTVSHGIGTLLTTICRSVCSYIRGAFEEISCFVPRSERHRGRAQRP